MNDRRPPRRGTLSAVLVGMATLALARVPIPAARAATEYEVEIPTTLGDTTETFWLQIPDAYDPAVPAPLLVGWHQLGGDHLEMRDGTLFDEEANTRGWIAVAHQGVGSMHWNNQATQSHVADVIAWVEQRFAVDPARIYMIGASMGGAAGMVFSNNHLDPAGPRVAAAVSFSGIQDCERRYREQGINNSMIAAFGGTPDQVPHAYHRNSAAFFADTTRSMHVNARHLPLLLVFGKGNTDAVWRAHAEDLHGLLAGLSDEVLLRESSLPGHGWACAEESLACAFLAEHALPPGEPERISVNADEEGTSWWARIRMRNPVASFARFEGSVDVGTASLRCTMIRNVQSAELDLRPFGFPLDGSFRCAWAVLDSGRSEISFAGVANPPCAVYRDGRIHVDWSHDAVAGVLRIGGEGAAVYQILGNVNGTPDGGEAEGELVRRVHIVRRGAKADLEGLVARLRARGIVDARGRLLWSRDAGEGAGPVLPAGIFWLQGSARGGAAGTKLIVLP